MAQLIMASICSSNVALGWLDAMLADVNSIGVVADGLRVSRALVVMLACSAGREFFGISSV